MPEWDATDLVPGRASGTALVLSEPLSFWGGVDPRRGIIVGRHRDAGRSVSGRVVVMPAGVGSSSSPSVLAELLRIGKGPAAVVLGENDPHIAVGALVADELYDAACPVVVSPEAVASVADGVLTTVAAGVVSQ